MQAIKLIQPAPDPARFVQCLHVEEDCLGLDYTQEIIERAKLPVQVLQHGAKPSFPATRDLYPASLSAGKSHLLLCRNRGVFFKPCPGTREYRCCDYQVLNIGMNCPMDCVYCILQAYLNNPWLSFFVNIDALFAELDQALAAEPQRLFRIGTGEFTDSLALDSLTRFSPRLVDYISRQSNAVLELKTKSVNIAHLEGLEHRGRTIVAWSLNSPVIVRKEELRTATLDERLAAAARCAEWGYGLAFHFDPIIQHEGWREGYRETIAALFARVPAAAIRWISLGALRYLPPLKPIAASRFPQSRFFFAESVEGLDGKRRYFRPQRVEMYRFIVEELHKYADNRTCIYFCMENDTIWREVFGYSPEERGGLRAMLDEAAEEEGSGIQRFV